MKKCTFFRCVLSFVLVLCMTFSYVLPAYAAEDDGISFEKVDNSTVKGSAIERETVRTDASAGNVFRTMPADFLYMDKIE